MDDQLFRQSRGGRRGAISVLLLACVASGFWLYQGFLRRQRLEWIAEVRSLGLPVVVMPASRWAARMYVPGPQRIVDYDVVIVMIDTEQQGQALLTSTEDCPDDVKIYAFDGLSAQRYAQIESRFPSAVLFTRLDN